MDQGRRWLGVRASKDLFLKASNLEGQLGHDMQNACGYSYDLLASKHKVAYMTQFYNSSLAGNNKYLDRLA